MRVALDRRASVTATIPFYIEPSPYDLLSVHEGPGRADEPMVNVIALYETVSVCKKYALVTKTGALLADDL
jgi:hypothetical protein